MLKLRFGIEDGRTRTLEEVGKEFNVTRERIRQIEAKALADGRLQTDGLLGDFQNLPDLVHGHVHFLGNLLGGGVVAQLLEELAGNPDDLVDGFHHVDRNADSPGLVGDGPGDGLANPPGGVGGEFIALGIVELLHRLDQAQVALLDEIQEQHAPPHVPLGDGNHQTEVGLGQLLLGPVALLDKLLELGQVLRGKIGCLRLVQLLLGQGSGVHFLSQVDLLLRGQQGHLADLLEVHTHRIVNGEAVHQGVGIYQILLLDVGDLVQRRVHVVGHFREDVLLAADLDGQGLKGVVNLLHLVAVQLDLVQDLHHFRRIQAAPLFAPGEQVHDFFICQQDGRRGQLFQRLVRQTGVFLLALRLLILCGAHGQLFLLFCERRRPPPAQGPDHPLRRPALRYGGGGGHPPAAAGRRAGGKVPGPDDGILQLPLPGQDLQPAAGGVGGGADHVGGIPGGGVRPGGNEPSDQHPAKAGGPGPRGPGPGGLHTGRPA